MVHFQNILAGHIFSIYLNLFQNTQIYFEIYFENLRKISPGFWVLFAILRGKVPLIIRIYFDFLEIKSQENLSDFEIKLNKFN